MESSIVIDGNNLYWKIYFTSNKEFLKKENQEHNYSKSLISYSIRHILSMASAFSPINEIVFCFDCHDGNWRKDVFKDYKAQRKKDENDEIVVINTIKASVSILESVGFKTLSYSKAEGDDLAYAYAKMYHKKNNIILYSTDADWIQMLSMENTRLFAPLKIEEKFYNKNILLEKAIVGDSSDNIKGVKGIGQKRLKDFLEKYLKKDPEAYKFKDLIDFYLEIIDLAKCPFLDKLEEFIKSKENYVFKIPSKLNLTRLFPYDSGAIYEKYKKLKTFS